MRCLVTGGAGFIGSHLVDLLLQRGYEVSVIDDFSTGKLSNLNCSNVKIIKKSITEISREDVEGIDIIFHLAAQVSTFKSVEYPEEDFERNAFGTFRILEILRRYNTNALFVYTSSRSVHGNVPEPYLADERWPYTPSTHYSLHKIYGEMLCKIYYELYGINYIIIRPSNVYGPRQPYWVRGWYNFISFWIQNALKDEPIPIYGTGEQIRDYVYVSDVATAYVLAIEQSKAINDTFLLCTSRGITLNQLANLILKLTNSKSEKRYFPPRKGDIMRFVGSYDKAKRILNWEPAVTLEDGLRKEIEWVQDSMNKEELTR